MMFEITLHTPQYVHSVYYVITFTKALHFIYKGSTTAFHLIKVV